MKGRNHTKADTARFRKIADGGCVVCLKYHGVYSPASIHHLNGKTKKGAHQQTIALCPNHHQHGGYGVAIHAGKKAFEAKYGTESDLLEYQNELIGV